MPKKKSEASSSDIQKIIDHLSYLHNKDELTKVAKNVSKDMEENLEAHSLIVHTRFDNIIEVANTRPDKLGTELTKRLREIIKEMVVSLKERDELHFQSTNKHKETILLLQKTQEEQNKIVAAQLTALRASLSEFKEYSLTQIKQTSDTLAILN